MRLIPSIGENQPVWCKVLNPMLEPQTLSSGNEIIEYLDCHRRDLPPSVWIKDRPRPKGLTELSGVTCEATIAFAPAIPGGAARCGT